jgi:hypothetical protein
MLLAYNVLILKVFVEGGEKVSIIMTSGGYLQPILEISF